MRPSDGTRLSLSRMAIYAALAGSLLTTVDAGAAPTHGTQERKVAVPGSRVDAGVARLVVHASEAEVMALIRDFSNYQQTISQFKRSQIVGKKAGSTDVYLQIPILHGATKVWAVLRFGPARAEGDTTVLSGSMLKGNVDKLDAEWRVRRIDDQHTQLELRLHLVPDLPFPGSIIADTVASAAGRAVRGVRDAVQR